MAGAGVVRGATIIITIALLFNSPRIVNGQTFTKETYPDPRVDYSACGNSGPSWVCDPGNYLSNQQADDLNGLLSGFNQNPGGAAPIVMVGLLPTTGLTVSGLKDFTQYLHDTSWRQYSTNLLVVVVNQLGVWISTSSTSLTEECICQLTYEARQYLESRDYDALLDIYARRFIDILAGQQPCQTNIADNTPWQVGKDGFCTWDKDKKIFIAGINPLVGLPRSQATITISGRNLNQAESARVGTKSCLITSKSDTRIVCTTTAQQQTVPAAIDTPLPVYLVLSGAVNYDTGKRFIYTNPTITNVSPRTTIISGGLLLTVEGSHLNLASMAIMKTELRSTQTNQRAQYQTTCTVKSPTSMLCPTPKLDLSDVRPTSKKKRDLTIDTMRNLRPSHINRASSSIIKHRTARAAADESIPVDDVDVNVEFELNGREVGVVDTNSQPVPLNLYEDPELEPFEDEDRTKTFVSVWPVNDRTIEIKGSRLLPALRGHSLDLKVGSGGCETGEIFTNRLICDPPVKKPQSEGENPRVQANVGTREFDIGYLKYIDNLWDYPPARWGIIGGAAALLVILTIVAVCCCYKRTSNKGGGQGHHKYGHHQNGPQQRNFQHPPHYPQHPQQHRQKGHPQGHPQGHPRGHPQGHPHHQQKRGLPRRY